MNIIQTDDKTRQDLGILVLAVFLPPLAVGLEFGFGQEFVLNVLLTLFGYIPGIIHACWIVNKPSKKDVQSAMKSTKENVEATVKSNRK